MRCTPKLNLSKDLACLLAQLAHWGPGPRIGTRDLDRDWDWGPGPGPGGPGPGPGYAVKRVMYVIATLTGMLSEGRGVHISIIHELDATFEHEISAQHIRY